MLQPSSNRWSMSITINRCISKTVGCRPCWGASRALQRSEWCCGVWCMVEGCSSNLMVGCVGSSCFLSFMALALLPINSPPCCFTQADLTECFLVHESKWRHVIHGPEMTDRQKDSRGAQEQCGWDVESWINRCRQSYISDQRYASEIPGLFFPSPVGTVLGDWHKLHSVLWRSKR